MHCTNYGYLGKLLVQCKVQWPMVAIFGPYLDDPIREHWLQEFGGYCADNSHVTGHLRTLLDKGVDTFHCQGVAAHKAEHHLEGRVLLAQRGVDLWSGLDLCTSHEEEKKQEEGEKKEKEGEKEEKKEEGEKEEKKKEGESGDEGTTIQIYLAEGGKINLVSCTRRRPSYFNDKRPSYHRQNPWI